MLNEALSQYVDSTALWIQVPVSTPAAGELRAFAERHGDEHIRVARVIDWADPSTVAASAPQPFARRAQFGLCMHARIHVTKIPAADAIGRGHSAVEPRIYTRQEKLRALMKAAAGLETLGFDPSH